jgi:hypothetical protein
MIQKNTKEARRDLEGRNIMVKYRSLVALLMLIGSTVSAKSGDDILQLVDAAASAAQDQSFQYECRTSEAGKDDRVLVFDVYIKGTKWRRIDFVSPGDVKDMRVLVKSTESMYVYLPAFKKVRRLASHVKEQGFMGTSFSHDEMSLVTYAPSFSAKLLQESKRGWTLEAKRRTGVSFPYPKLILEIRKDIKQLVEIQYFNDQGIHSKTETRLNYNCERKVCAPGKLVMVDHTRNDLKSTLTRLKWKPNSGISDKIFTLRALQRGL